MNPSHSGTRVLLTGATGLVGRFVLAELLRRRVATTVIVRGRSRVTAAERIDEALAHFERDHYLPRPRVIEGDLTKADLGIHSSELAHLQGAPVAVVHCAASIRFLADGGDGEPYRSNVDGTRRLLELCRQIPVDSFHHVSTAYTQSRRQVYATAWEQAVATDAPAGNDYERSKIIAEDLVRQCPWPPTKTFLRPSIVVGDSRTAYTSSFHGFYSMLQVGRQLAQLLGGDPTAGPWFREQLGIRENDTKNLVPVDWVAAAIVHILLRPALHGRTYHLTNPQPVPASEMQRAIIDCLHDEYVRTHGAGPTAMDWDAVDSSPFREQIRVYEAYFGDDPLFDRTHAAQALQAVPCPDVNYDLLVKLAKFALETNFGWPRRQPAPNPFFGQFWDEACGSSSDARSPVEDECWLELIGLGATGPLRFQKLAGRWFAAGIQHAAHTIQTRMATSTDVLAGCLIGKFDPGDCIETGRWVILNGSQRNWVAFVRQLVHDVRLPTSAGPSTSAAAHAAEIHNIV